jgi:hypothetical protein
MTRIGRPPVAPETRFFRFLVESGDCWVWTGTVDRSGYGTFSVTTTVRQKAHRWAYEFLRAPIPVGLQLDHLCRNPSCVNPWHLEPVTPQVNTLRGKSPAATNATKDRCKRGHPLSGENLRAQASGRECHECRLDIYRRYRLRKKAAA